MEQIFELRNLVFVGAVVNVLGAIPYILETLRGETKPNRVTWLLWTIASFIAVAAAFASGVRWAAVPVFAAGLVPLLVCVSSFVNKQAYWKLETFDYLCGTGSALALLLWWLTNEPAIAIVFAILSDSLAAIPTVTKSWQHPETENVLAYIAGFFNAFTSLFAIEIMSFASLAYPIYLMLLMLVLILVLNRHRLLPSASTR